MYLGNSDHTKDFVGGIIEGDLIANAIGYGMQIKAQGVDRDPEFSSVPGMAVGDEKTVIRHNVFIKDRDYAIAARQNLLVCGFPDSGSGSNDHYEIYGKMLHLVFERAYCLLCASDALFRTFLRLRLQ